MKRDKIKFFDPFKMNKLSGLTRLASVKIVIFLLLILSINGCLDSSFKRGAYKDYNVIVVLIDALRYDHLGCYGYKRDTSPNIDRLSKESLVFMNAIAQASWTKPSVVSLFTSNYVRDRGITYFTKDYIESMPNNVLPSSVITLG